MITIEIENPAEVAARQSFWARTLGGLAPAFVQRKVEEKVVASLHEVFEGHGIRARITIHPPSSGASWQT
jgi:hypothetical protein